jgi:integrase/recombinase XerD
VFFNNKRKGTQMKQAKVLIEVELKRLVAVVDAGKHAARNRMAVMLSYFAGMRVGEIAALTVGDVFDNVGDVRDQILLKAAYTKGKETRTVFVSAKLKRELKNFKNAVGNLSSSDKPLLMTQKRTAFSANTLCQLFGELYRKSGLDGATSHSGRRSFITKLAHNGVSAKVIMTLAGHKNLSTTQRYIEVNDEMLRKAVEVV